MTSPECSTCPVCSMLQPEAATISEEVRLMTALLAGWVGGVIACSGGSEVGNGIELFCARHVAALLDGIKPAAEAYRIGLARKRGRRG